QEDDGLMARRPASHWSVRHRLGAGVTVGSREPTSSYRSGGVESALSTKESRMDCTRRVFFTTASGVALSARMSAASVQGANSRVRVAVIGTGGRARSLMNQLKPIPGVEIVGLCDVFEPRLLQAAEIAGPAALKTAEYRRILDDREIDAVLI